MKVENTNNSRIAKNSIMLYFRMLFNMAVTFYTSRILLNILGVTDFGIYGIVGGIVALFGFLNGSMSSATSRFLTFELGQGNFERLKKTFSSAFIAHLIIGLIILILAETIGLWWFENKLVIDPNRIVAARWVYHFSIITSIITIIQVPFNALIIAHEKMNAFAYIEILNTFLKLSVVLLLQLNYMDNLILYSFLILLTTSLITLIYKIYCNYHFNESKYSSKVSKDIIKPMLSFSGWELFGNFANMAKSQGNNILLNLFFGVVLNAAYAISNQVYGAVGQFIGSFQMAVTPQIVKSYANDDMPRFFNLIYKSCRLSYLIMLIPVIPIFYNIDFILAFWLKNPPTYTSEFVILILIDTMINSLVGPLAIGAKATGKIKKYQIIVGLLLFLNLPITYFIFLVYKIPTLMFWIRIILSLITLVYRLIFLKSVVALPITDFLKNVILKIVLPSVIIFTTYYFFKNFISSANTLSSFIAQSTFIIFFTVVNIYIFGISSSEKNMINNKFKAIITRN